MLKWILLELVWIFFFFFLFSLRYNQGNPLVFLDMKYDCYNKFPIQKCKSNNVNLIVAWSKSLNSFNLSWLYGTSQVIFIISRIHHLFFILNFIG